MKLGEQWVVTTASSRPNKSLPWHKPHQQILSDCSTAGDFSFCMWNVKQPMQRNLLMEKQVFSDSVNKATSSWIAGFFLLQWSRSTKLNYGKVLASFAIFNQNIWTSFLYKVQRTKRSKDWCDIILVSVINDQTLCHYKLTAQRKHWTFSFLFFFFTNVDFKGFIRF